MYIIWKHMKTSTSIRNWQVTFPANPCCFSLSSTNKNPTCQVAPNSSSHGIYAPRHGKFMCPIWRIPMGSEGTIICMKTIQPNAATYTWIHHGTWMFFLSFFFKSRFIDVKMMYFGNHFHKRLLLWYAVLKTPVACSSWWSFIECCTVTLYSFQNLVCSVSRMKE